MTRSNPKPDPKQRLVGQAIRLFRAKGDSATSIEDVLKACGLSKGALYHHFESWDAPAIAAMAQVHRQFDQCIFTRKKLSRPF